MRKVTEFYYFSPTGGTKKAGEIFCGGISEKVKMIDLGLRDQEAGQPESGLAVVAAPVFGGRVPAVVARRLSGLDGKGKKAVTLAVYGNRAYEDALLELNHVMEKQGFRVIASAALIARHSIVPALAEGRPDGQDRKEILDFAGKVLKLLEQGTANPVKVPGNDPYKEGMRVTASPISLPSCARCGTCEQACPTGAIRRENGVMATNPEECILCMACTAACPEHARILPPPLREGMEQKLAPFKTVRKENEFFL